MRRLLAPSFIVVLAVCASYGQMATVLLSVPTSPTTEGANETKALQSYADSVAATLKDRCKSEISQSGTVDVEVVIWRKGQVASVQIMRPTPNQLNMEYAVLQCVAAPYPVFPKELDAPDSERGAVIVLARFAFNLQRVPDPLLTERTIQRQFQLP